MDITSNKIAAYILDKGKHSEWSRTDGKQPRIVRHTNDNVITIKADALVFSIGMQTEHGAVELILGITPVSRMTFSLGNADCYSYAFMVKVSMPESPSSSITTVPDPDAYRRVFKHIFGFDGLTTVVRLMDVKYFDRMDDDKLYVEDKQFNRLKDIVYGIDTEVSQAMSAAGFSFVAARKVVDSEPQPVFWANGNYTTSSTAEDELAFNALNIAVNSHLQTRYLNALLSPALGFCPHLSV